MPPIESLLAKPRQARAHFAANVAKYHSPHLVRSLLDRSRELRFENPGEMLHLAHLATVIAPHCKGEERERLDLLGEVWVHLANALKVRGVLRTSEAAFRKSKQFLDKTDRQDLRASYLECFAALRLRQVRLEEAKSFVVEALAIREQLGEISAIASTLNQLAVLESDSRQYVTALRHLSRANRLIPWDKDPRLCLLSRHNTIYVLTAMGRSTIALNLYERIQPLYATAGDKMFRLRGEWLFAKVAASFGRADTDETAERAFRATAQAAIELELPYESAKVLFEMGSFFASRGRWHRLEMVVIEALNLLDYLGIGRDAAVARVLLLAARQRRQSLNLLSRAGLLINRHAFSAAA
jgi:tetratricopeptide (TPR) repeat protein